MPRTSVQRSLESLVKELSELRATKAAYDKLEKAHVELSRLVAKVTGAAVGARRGPGRPAKAPGAARRRGKGGKRFRSSSADVQKAYESLASKAGKEWVTKDQLVKAAGLKSGQVAAAWKRLMEGYKTADGKAVKPVLESNGSRGLKGRYRKR